MFEIFSGISFMFEESPSFSVKNFFDYLHSFVYFLQDGTIQGDIIMEALWSTINERTQVSKHDAEKVY